MIDMKALVEDSQMDTLLGALPSLFWATVVMKLKFNPGDLSTFVYNKCTRQYLATDATADAITHLGSAEACTDPGVSAFPAPAQVPLQQMPAVVNLSAVRNEKSVAQCNIVRTFPELK